MKTVTDSTYRVLCNLCDAVLWDARPPPDEHGNVYKTIAVAGREFWISDTHKAIGSSFNGSCDFYLWTVHTRDDPWTIRFRRRAEVWFAPAGYRRGRVAAPPQWPVAERTSVQFVGDRRVFERDMLTVKMFLDPNSHPLADIA